jgi:hypothetical protein
MVSGSECGARHDPSQRAIGRDPPSLMLASDLLDLVEVHSTKVDRAAG